MPQGGLEALNTKDPLDIYAYQYDLVCNGYEMASGAVRNHDPEIMVKAFEIAGYTEEDVKERFGALYNAFQYGTPPHAGAAPGIDRTGAVRNHDPEIMVKAFEIAGYTEEDVKERFGALYNAFQYGTPPHAGAAPGIDRMVMLIADSQNIREVIAFPKNKKARDLLMRAPSVVSNEQLKDVHIKLDLEK